MAVSSTLNSIPTPQIITGIILNCTTFFVLLRTWNGDPGSLMLPSPIFCSHNTTPPKRGRGLIPSSPHFPLWVLRAHCSHEELPLQIIVYAMRFIDITLLACYTGYRTTLICLETPQATTTPDIIIYTNEAPHTAPTELTCVPLPLLK